jgi:hypothetical protein
MAGMRFLIPPGANDVLDKLPLFEVVPLEITEEFVSKKFLAFPKRIGSEDAPLWAADSNLPDYRTRSGFVMRAGDLTG